MRVAVDTNVVSSLARGKHPEFRTALESAVAKGLVRVPLTTPLAQELCAQESGQHAKMAGLVRSLCRELLIPYGDRVAWEVTSGHRLPEREAFTTGAQFHNALRDIEEGRTALAKRRLLAKKKRVLGRIRGSRTRIRGSTGAAAWR